MSNTNENDELKYCKITPNEVKKYPGFEDLNEEETNEIIESLFQLSLVAYSIYHNNSKN
jgi:hypothetical protein